MPTTRHPTAYDSDGFPAEPLRRGRVYTPGCDHQWTGGTCWRCGGIHGDDEEAA